jgi:hypothetical protein
MDTFLVLFPIILITVVIFCIIALRLTDRINKKQQFLYSLATLLLPIPYYFIVLKSTEGAVLYSILLFLPLCIILLVGWFRDK